VAQQPPRVPDVGAPRAGLVAGGPELYIIRGMELLGLAWQVRVPAPATLEAKRIKPREQE